MTLDAVDAQLAEWQEQLALAGSNLIELDDLFTYKRLRGEIGETPPLLTGITATRVIPALAAIQDIWQYLQMLQELLRRAQEVRKSVRLWSQERVVQEIEQMLTGPSLSLGTTQKPLALRGLLSTSKQTENGHPRRRPPVYDTGLRDRQGHHPRSRCRLAAPGAILSDLEAELAALSARAADLGSDAEAGADAPSQQVEDALRTRRHRSARASIPIWLTSSSRRNRVRARLDAIVEQAAEALALQRAPKGC